LSHGQLNDDPCFKRECGRTKNENRMNLSNPEQSDAFINEQEVFKVVDCYLRSCSAVGAYSVQFRLGEFVAAPAGTKFFVFESLIHAKNFRNKDLHLCIFGATARGLCSAARRISDARHSIDIEDFWRVHNIGRSYGVLGGYRTPPGTLWADAIRLDECLCAAVGEH
jgi:hypothetical protein